MFFMPRCYTDEVNRRGFLNVLGVTLLCVLLALFIPFFFFHKKDPVSWMVPLIEFSLYIYFQLKKKKYICYVGKTRIENTPMSWIWIICTITGISVFTNIVVFS